MSDDLVRETWLSVQRAVAMQLWQLGAVKVNVKRPFRLVSGSYSPVYVNCRQLISSPIFLDTFILAARILYEQRQIVFDVVAGGETAGIPFASFVAQRFGQPLVYVRKAVKTHGIAARVEGVLSKGVRVLLIEDLITNAASKLGFIEAIRDSGGTVADVLVVFDRLQGGREALESEGIRLHAIADMNLALSVAESAGLLSRQDLYEVKEYLRDPEKWSKRSGVTEGGTSRGK